MRCSRAWRCKLNAAVGSSCSTVPSSCGKTTRVGTVWSENSVVGSSVTDEALPTRVSISAEYVVFESAVPPRANVTRDQIAAGGGNKPAEAPRSSPSSRSAAKRSSSASPCSRSTRVSYMVSSPSCASSVSRATRAIPHGLRALGLASLRGESQLISSLTTSIKTHASRHERSTVTRHLASARVSSASASTWSRLSTLRRSRFSPSMLGRSPMTSPLTACRRGWRANEVAEGWRQ